jgi:hypothetical protein
VNQGIAEIRTTDTIIEELHRQARRPRQQRNFRFPYGNKGNGPPSTPRHEPELMSKRQTYQECLRALRYTALASAGANSDVDWEWTYSTNDWSPFYPEVALPDFRKPAQVLDAVRAWNPPDDNLQPEIIIMHDTPDESAHRLFCDLIEVLVGKGLPFARLTRD